MPQIATADFKNGMTIDLDEGLFNIVEFQHVKPGKGGAFVRTTLKNSRTGAVVERTFRAGERMERAIIDKREMQLLYRDGDDYVFMDNESYDQMNVPAADAGRQRQLPRGLLDRHAPDVRRRDHRRRAPGVGRLNIAETEPGVQGDRVSGAKKPATLVTGLVVAVPLFINPGEAIKVDTRSGDFISRA